MPLGYGDGMRFGVFLTLDYHPACHPPKPDYLRDALDLAEHCDRLGLEVWVAEHHFSDYGTMPATAAFLAACAARTRRVRLGSAVAVLPLHHPLRVAEDYGLVDVLSGGRLEFGVGSGYLRHELDGFRVAAEEKRERFDVALDLVLRAWAGEEVRSGNRFWPVEGVRLNLLPIQRPHPPVWVGTTRPDPAPHIGRAGRRLLTVPYVYARGWDELAASLRAYRAGWQEAGWDGEAMVAIACHAYVAGGPGGEEGLAEAEEALARYLETRLVPGARASGEPLPADFAWLGDAEVVAGQVARAEALGVDLVLLIADFGGLSRDRVRASLSRFAERVAPRFRTPR